MGEGDYSLHPVHFIYSICPLYYCGTVRASAWCFFIYLFYKQLCNYDSEYVSTVDRLEFRVT